MSLNEKLGNENAVLVSKHDIMFLTQIDAICESTQMRNLVLSPSIDADKSKLFYGFFSRQEKLRFLKFAQYVQRKHNKNLFVYGGYSVESVAKVSDAILDLADRINSAKIESVGRFRGLSPLEKCLYVHNVASSISYGSSENPASCKSIYGGLIDGNMDCSGRANFMCELLKLCSIPAVTETFIMREGDKYDFESAFHRVCKVLLFDPIYQIKGVYICDPTFDVENENLPARFDYAMLSMREYLNKTYADVDFSQDLKGLLKVYRNISKIKTTDDKELARLEDLTANSLVINRGWLVNSLINMFVAKGNTREDAIKKVQERFERLDAQDAEFLTERE